MDDDKDDGTYEEEQEDCMDSKLETIYINLPGM